MQDTFDMSALTVELTRDEGRRARIYVDSARKISGGVGRNLSDVPFSDDEINLMFCNDVRKATADLDRHATWWRRLDPARQRVMVNMCFNMGWPVLAEFRHFLAAMEAGLWNSAALAMENSLWWNEVGARAVRLRDVVLTGGK